MVQKMAGSKNIILQTNLGTTMIIYIWQNLVILNLLQNITYDKYFNACTTKTKKPYIVFTINTIINMIIFIFIFTIINITITLTNIRITKSNSRFSTKNITTTIYNSIITTINFSTFSNAMSIIIISYTFAITLSTTICITLASPVSPSPS